MSGFVEWLLLTMDNRRRFPMNFANFIRTPFLQNNSDGCFYYGQKKDFLSDRMDQVFL